MWTPSIGPTHRPLPHRLLPLTCLLASSLAFQATAAVEEDEGDSVYGWGRWLVLAPAAGVEETAATSTLAPVGTDNNLRPGEASQLAREVIIPLIVDPPPGQSGGGEVIGPCSSGQGCGLATIKEGSWTLGSSNAGGTSPANFTLTQDTALGFALSEAGFDGDAVNNPSYRSLDLPVDSPHGPLLTPQATVGDTSSQLIAFVEYAADGATINQVTNGRWSHASNGEVHSGQLVWGIARDLETMNLGNVTLNLTGHMNDTVKMTDVATRMNLQITLGSQPGWTGAWSGTNNFEVTKGSISGPNLKATEFSPGTTGTVQGYTMAKGSDISAGMGVDVNIDGKRYVDVGLARTVP